MDGDWKWRCFLDIETLNCPVCKDPLSRPIFQCENGHRICSSCTGQARIIRDGCPSCYEPTGRIRNLAMEKILDTLEVPCKHGPHGCPKMFSFINREERKDHEEQSCPFQPFPCPFASCSHEGPLAVFSSHLTDAHNVTRRLCDLSGKDRETFRMSSEQSGVLLERPRSGEGVDAVNGLSLVHRQDGDSLGDWFFFSAFGIRLGYTLVVKRADSEVAYSLSGIAPDFSRARARTEGAGAVGERLLVPVPRVAKQIGHGKLFGVVVILFPDKEAEQLRVELDKITGDARESDD